jgi:hypothetical protein
VFTVIKLIGIHVMAIQDVIEIVEERINVLARYLNKHKKSQVNMQSQFNKLLDRYNRLIENQRGDALDQPLSDSYEDMFGSDYPFGNDEEQTDHEKPKLVLPKED